MNKSELINKAKLIYYMNSNGKPYYENSYKSHLDEMLSVLQTFKYKDSDLECGVWLFNARYPRVNTIQDFGDRIFHMIHYTSLRYPEMKLNKDAVVLTVCDRIAHANFFLENGKKGAYDAFHKHHTLFHRLLYEKGQCDTMWAYLDTLMERDWNNLMCV